MNGKIIHRCGIKVLDGTENWNPSRSYNGLFYIDGEFPQVVLPNTPICTHFTGVSSTITSANLPDKSIRCGFWGYPQSLYIKNTDFGLNVNAFKQWLADQYQAGFPVIVIYPLATATTESVTPQPLTIQEGTNIVEITQASMDNLELEVSYKAGVAVTITEIENAQLDNSVEVTVNG